jgi:hypothetical protein
MNTHADKTQENKSQAVANSLPKQQSNGEPAFHFVNNRPEAIAQKKLQEIANNSPQVKQLTALREMFDKNSIQQRPVQRKMIFGYGTEDLDAAKERNAITNTSYIKVQNKAKGIEQDIILALGAQSTSEQAKFHPYGKGGLINVKPLPDESDRDYHYARSGRLIAIIHETQHALDHLHPDSPLLGEFGQLTGEKGVRTELNAFAAQAAETEQLLKEKKPVEQKHVDMARAFSESTPEAPTELLLSLMKYYAWLYSNKYKESNPDFEKVSNTETLINTTKRYIAKYLSESKAIYKALMTD